MVRQSLRYLCLVLVAGLAKSAATLAGTAVPTTVDFPGSDGTRAYGINKAGDIVGTYELRDPAVVVHSHGFLLANGHFTTIDFPGGFGTEAYGINAAGDIVGVYWDNRGAYRGRHGFLMRGGRFTRIDGPHAVVTRALGIDDGGDIVGVYTVREASGIPGSEAPNLLFRLLGHPYPYDYEYGHGFVYAKGRFSNVDFPGAARGEQTMANAINAAGQIVGNYLDRNYVASGFLLTKASYVSVDVPGPGATLVTGVNMAGQVVGHRDSSGFLWDQGRVTVIDTRVLPGAQLTVPWGINDTGTIVGYYSTTPYHEHGFMLNPDR